MHGAMLRGGAMMASPCQRSLRRTAARLPRWLHNGPRRNLSEEIGQEPPRGASNLNLDEPPSVLEVSQENAHDVNVVGRVALPKEANGQLAGAFRELLEFRTETAKLRAETAEFQAKLRAETAELAEKPLTSARTSPLLTIASAC